MNARRLGDVDRAIHAPARLMIMAILNSAEVDFVYLLNETGLSKGNLAAHLAKLEASGYIAVEKGYRGRVPLTTYRITEAGQVAFTRYRETLQRFLEATAPGVKLATR